MAVAIQESASFKCTLVVSSEQYSCTNTDIHLLSPYIQRTNCSTFGTGHSNFSRRRKHFPTKKCLTSICVILIIVKVLQIAHCRKMDAPFKTTVFLQWTQMEAISTLKYSNSTIITAYVGFPDGLPFRGCPPNLLIFKQFCSWTSKYWPKLRLTCVVYNMYIAYHVQFWKGDTVARYKCSSATSSWRSKQVTEKRKGGGEEGAYQCCDAIRKKN